MEDDALWRAWHPDGAGPFVQRAITEMPDAVFLEDDNPEESEGSEDVPADTEWLIKVRDLGHQPPPLFTDPCVFRLKMMLTPS